MREKTAAPKQNEERTRMPVVKLQRIMIKLQLFIAQNFTTKQHKDNI